MGATFADPRVLSPESAVGRAKKNLFPSPKRAVYEGLKKVKVYGDAKNRTGAKSTRRKKLLGPHIHSGRKLQTFSK